MILQCMDAPFKYLDDLCLTVDLFSGVSFTAQWLTGHIQYTQNKTNNILSPPNKS